MKSFIIAAAATSAFAVAPPRIELDLSGGVAPDTGSQLYGSHIGGDATHAYTGESCANAHTGACTTPTYGENGEPTGAHAAVQSRMDWTQECDASTASVENCPFPVPRAFDHNDQVIIPTTNVYIVDYDGQTNSADQPSAPLGELGASIVLPAKVFPDSTHSTAADLLINVAEPTFYQKRWTALFKYDAVDDAGNRADQVVFALVMNDHEAPTITSCYGPESEIDIEAASTKSATAALTSDDFVFFCERDLHVTNAAAVLAMPILDNMEQGAKDTAASATQSAFSAIDDIDTIPNSDITFDIYADTTCASVTADTVSDRSGQTLAATNAYLSTTLSAEEAEAGGKSWAVNARVTDYASYYGEEGNDNEAQLCTSFAISDNVGPTIIPSATGIEYGECCKASLTAVECNTPATGYAGYSLSGFVGHLPAVSARDANDDQQGNSLEWAVEGSFMVDGETLTSDGQEIEDTSPPQYEVDLTSVTAAGTTSPHKKVYYRVTDSTGNPGTYESDEFFLRTVRVVDRSPPTIELGSTPESVTLHSRYEHYNTTETLEAYMDASGVDDVTYADTCQDDDALVPVFTWESDAAPGDLTELGQFTREYKVCQAGYDDVTCDGTTTWGAHIAALADGETPCCASGVGLAAVAVPCCSETVTRVFHVIDDEKPEINPMGDLVMHIPASNEQEYTDAGATCNDYVDGVLSHAVEVSGQVVNMRVPGDYVIRYDCVDLSGKEADPAFRTVKVEDNTCPTIVLNVPFEAYVEAGFPYEDAGFTCTDDLDGVISGKGPFSEGVAGCVTDGNTVTTSKAFYNARSCKDIQAACASNDHTCETGVYDITRNDEATMAPRRVQVWCYMEADSAPTFYTALDEEATSTNSDGVEEGQACTDLGMELACVSGPEDCPFYDVLQDKLFEGDYKELLFPDIPATVRTSYLCTLNDEDTAAAAVDHRFDDQHMRHHGILGSNTGTYGAEEGAYEITFMCKDKQGNRDCAWQQNWACRNDPDCDETLDANKKATRTVFVKDTMPPVLTLHLNGKLVAHSNADQTALDGETMNPAGTVEGNPYMAADYPASLMSETAESSVNGWVLGAVASAVSGLALLGYSMRRTNANVVSVPV